MLRKMFLPCVLLLCATPLLSQNAPPAGSGPNPGRPMHGANAGACFQRAGLDKSVMGQLMSIQREAHSQVEGVCSNTSLTPEQKHQQVEEIHRQAHEKLGGLITPEQEKELMACRQQQQGGNQSGNGLLRMGGGCGERGRGGMRRGGANGGTQNPTGSGNPSSSTQSPSQN